MILYHFTAAHMLQGCMADGLTLGSVPVVKDGNVGLMYGYQWLTESDEFIQSWCEGGTLPYDRTACRLTIKIPKIREKHLIKWTDKCAGTGMEDILNSHCDPHHWWLYKGEVKPQWIIDIEYKNSKEQLGSLSKNHRRYLSHRVCGWCEQRLDRERCASIYGPPCDDELMMQRRKNCLKEYKQRHPGRVK